MRLATLMCLVLASVSALPFRRHNRERGVTPSTLDEIGDDIDSLIDVFERTNTKTGCTTCANPSSEFVKSCNPPEASESMATLHDKPAQISCTHMTGVFAGTGKKINPSTGVFDDADKEAVCKKALDMTTNALKAFTKDATDAAAFKDIMDSMNEDIKNFNPEGCSKSDGKIGNSAWTMVLWSGFDDKQTTHMNALETFRAGKNKGITMGLTRFNHALAACHDLLKKNDVETNFYKVSDGGKYVHEFGDTELKTMLIGTTPCFDSWTDAMLPAWRMSSRAFVEAWNQANEAGGEYYVFGGPGLGKWSPPANGVFATDEIDQVRTLLAPAQQSPAHKPARPTL